MQLGLPGAEFFFDVGTSRPWKFMKDARGRPRPRVVSSSSQSFSTQITRHFCATLTWNFQNPSSGARDVMLAQWMRCALHRHFCAQTICCIHAQARLRPASSPLHFFRHYLFSVFWGSPGENIFFLTLLRFVCPFTDMRGDLGDHFVTALPAMRVANGKVGIPAMLNLVLIRPNIKTQLATCFLSLRSMCSHAVLSRRSQLCLNCSCVACVSIMPACYAPANLYLPRSPYARSS
jgi:hypothetical protein